MGITAHTAVISTIQQGVANGKIMMIKGELTLRCQVRRVTLLAARSCLHFDSLLLSSLSVSAPPLSLSLSFSLSFSSHVHTISASGGLAVGTISCPFVLLPSKRYKAFVPKDAHGHLDNAKWEKKNKPNE